MDQHNEIQEIMGRSYGIQEDIDEADLDAEVCSLWLQCCQILWCGPGLAKSAGSCSALPPICFGLFLLCSGLCEALLRLLLEAM